LAIVLLVGFLSIFLTSSPHALEIMNIFLVIGAFVCVVTAFSGADRTLFKLSMHNFDFYYISGNFIVYLFGNVVSSVRRSDPLFTTICTTLTTLFDAIMLLGVDTLVGIRKSFRVALFVVSLIGFVWELIQVSYNSDPSVASDVPLFPGLITTTPRNISRIGLLNSVIFMIKALYNFRHKHRLVFSRIYLKVDRETRESQF